MLNTILKSSSHKIHIEINNATTQTRNTAETNKLKAIWLLAKFSNRKLLKNPVKKDEIVIFPNNLGVGIGNADISGYGTLKKGIFLNESRLFGIAKKKDESKSTKS